LGLGLGFFQPLHGDAKPTGLPSMGGGRAAEWGILQADTDHAGTQVAKGAPECHQHSGAYPRTHKGEHP